VCEIFDGKVEMKEGRENHGKAAGVGGMDKGMG
jgi:hypothetical protein